jgi:hypothetical protein
MKRAGVAAVAVEPLVVRQLNHGGGLIGAGSGAAIGAAAAGGHGAALGAGWGGRCSGRPYHDATAVSLLDSAQDRYFSRRAVAYIRDIGRVKNVTSAATGCSRAVFRENNVLERNLISAVYTFGTGGSAGSEVVQ